MVVSLDALARGAPALAALQLVLRLRDFDAGGFNMAMLWHALERLGRLSALKSAWTSGTMWSKTSASSWLRSWTRWTHACRA